MTIKMLQFEKFQGKKDTTFRCSNRKGSNEISQAIFLLQNPALSLPLALWKASERQISSLILTKWRSSFVIMGPYNVFVILISRAGA